MSEPPQVRVLNRDEWDVLRELRLQSLADSPNDLLGDLAFAEEQDWRYWTRKVVSSVWLVARVDGIDVGLVRLNRADDGDHVESLWVDPEYRGRGVATRMLDNIQGVTSVFFNESALHCWVFVDNVVGRLVVRKSGFKETGLQQTITVNGRETIEIHHKRSFTDET